MKIKGVIFDLDGTLLDSLDDVTNFANAVLLTYGFECRKKEEYRYLAGQGAVNLMANASGCKDGELISKMAIEFKNLYADSKGSATVFYGIQNVLDRLQAKAIKMAVLSNKPDSLTKSCVLRYFEEYRFEAVVGQIDGVAIKPDPTSALKIADIFSLKPSQIAVIGDTNNDILTAKAGGFLSIGVTWGFRGKGELISCGADFVVDEPSELLNVLF